MFLFNNKQTKNNVRAFFFFVKDVVPSLSLGGSRAFSRQVFPLLASLVTSFSPSSVSSLPLTFPPHLTLLFITLSSLLFLGFLSVHNPRVQLQVHTGRYNPAERYSPPLRPHLSLSASLSSTPTSASVWSLLVLGDKLLPSCLGLSLYVSVLFASSLLCHTFPGLHGCNVVSRWLQATVFLNQRPVWWLSVSIKEVKICKCEGHLLSFIYSKKNPTKKRYWIIL